MIFLHDWSLTFDWYQEKGTGSPSFSYPALAAS